MALQIINGDYIEVIDLGIIDSDAEEVFGVAVAKGVIVDLGHIDESDEVDEVYGVRRYVSPGANPIVVSLREIDEPDEWYYPAVYIIPARSYRRIQLDGGGRLLFESSIDDEQSERFFELWRNGKPFPLNNVSNPIFYWRSPTGKTGSTVARIIDPVFGRISAHLFPPTLAEVGTWELQLRYVDEVNFDRGSRDLTPPYAPEAGIQEFWRYLPRSLKVIVRSEGGW